MTNYAIMRCNKIKSFGQMSRTLKHNFREQDTPNADPERTDQNEHDGAERSTEAMGKIRERLPTKRRKDAVVAIEYLMTASPEFMKSATDKQKREFFDRSKQWLVDKYGKENVVLSSIHRDERSDHMAAWVTPITKDGRLCAKDFIGGPSKLRADQTSYHKAVEGLGLERGVIGSKAKHERIQAFYKAIEPHELGKDLERKQPPRIGENDIKRQRKGLKKETPWDTVSRINRKIASRWHEQEQYRMLRSVEVQRSQKAVRDSRVKDEKIREQAHDWRAYNKRLQTMDKQGIKAPDGRSMTSYINEKAKESAILERQEKQQQKDRQKGRDYDR